MGKVMNRILILGGGRYYLKAIEAAKKLGYYTIVIDREKDVPGYKIADKSRSIDIVDYEKVLEFAKDQKIDGIVPLNDYGVFTAAFVAENLGLSLYN